MSIVMVKYGDACHGYDNLIPWFNSIKSKNWFKFLSGLHAYVWYLISCGGSKCLLGLPRLASGLSVSGFPGCLYHQKTALIVQEIRYSGLAPKPLLFRNKHFFYLIFKLCVIGISYNFATFCPKFILHKFHFSMTFLPSPILPFPAASVLLTGKQSKFVSGQIWV